MNFQTFLLSFVIKIQVILFLSDFAEMSFCKQFVKNQFEIDFGYQRIRADNTSDYYLSIANIFWRIHFIDQRNSKSNKLLRITDIDIEVYFEARYKMAFCLYIGTECITGLMNSKVIDWVTLEDLNGIIHNQLYINSTNLKFQDFDPSIAFVPNFEQKSDKFVYFIEQKYNKLQNGFIRNMRYFYVESNLGAINEALDLSNGNSSVIQKIDSLSKDLKIIAYFSQFSEYEEKVSGSGNGMIIIIQIENVIKYCIYQLPFFKNKCQPDHLKTLIDCTEYKRPDPTIDTSGTFSSEMANSAEDEEKSVSWLTISIILLLTVIPIIVLLIIGAILLVKYQKDKKTKKNKTIESSVNESKDDKEENENEKSEAITIFKREGWNSNEPDSKTQ